MLAAHSVIITGGGTGIGYAVAQRFAAGGYGVSIVGRRRDVLEQAAERLSAPTAGVLAIAADVGEDGEAERATQAHVDRFGVPSTLVTAAAIYQPAPFLEISTELWDRLLRINLRGTMLSCQAAARRMAVAGGGKIVVFGSVVAQQSEPAGAAYSASKAAVASLARSMAVDLADKNIQVNCVAPGWVRTPMAAAEIDAAPPSRMKSINPLGRAADPEEIANLAWYLGHECPKFLTGETIVIDGGQTTRADVL